MDDDRALDGARIGMLGKNNIPGEFPPPADPPATGSVDLGDDRLLSYAFALYGLVSKSLEAFAPPATPAARFALL